MSLQQIQPALTLVQGWVKPLDLREVRNRTTAKTVAVAFIAFMTFHYLKRSYDWMQKFTNNDQHSYELIHFAIEAKFGKKRGAFFICSRRRTKIGQTAADKKILKDIYKEKNGEEEGDVVLVECRSERGFPRVILLDIEGENLAALHFDLKREVVYLEDDDHGSKN